MKAPAEPRNHSAPLRASEGEQELGGENTAVVYTHNGHILNGHGLGAGGVNGLLGGAQWAKRANGIRQLPGCTEVNGLQIHPGNTRQK